MARLSVSSVWRASRAKSFQHCLRDVPLDSQIVRASVRVKLPPSLSPSTLPWRASEFCIVHDGKKVDASTVAAGVTVALSLGSRVLLLLLLLGSSVLQSVTLTC